MLTQRNTIPVRKVVGITDGWTEGAVVGEPTNVKFRLFLKKLQLSQLKRGKNTCRKSGSNYGWVD